jgi:hypothetical protein
LNRWALVLAAALGAGCSTAGRPQPIDHFFTRFALPPAPTLVLVTASWSNRGLAVGQQLDEILPGVPQVQVVTVLMDQLPPAAWAAVRAELRLPGAVRKPFGLGLDEAPLGPIKEVPMLLFVDRRGRLMRRAWGWVDDHELADALKALEQGR